MNLFDPVLFTVIVKKKNAFITSGICYMYATNTGSCIDITLAKQPFAMYAYM